MLKIEKLNAKRSGIQILNGINLSVKPGEVHAIMGKNGSGKSTFANAIMGNPEVTVNSGKIFIDNKDITTEDVNTRAKNGLFMAFQYPVEISGVPIIKFLKLAYEQRFNKKIILPNFLQILNQKAELLNVDKNLINRYLNEGFSGGEKKKLEVLQMAILEPKYCILDETDSGLDVSALKEVALGITSLIKKYNMGVIVITHYSRILKYLKPDYVHIMQKGELVKSGGIDLAHKLEDSGYENL